MLAFRFRSDDDLSAYQLDAVKLCATVRAQLEGFCCIFEQGAHLGISPHAWVVVLKFANRFDIL